FNRQLRHTRRLRPVVRGRRIVRSRLIVWPPFSAAALRKLDKNYFRTVDLVFFVAALRDNPEGVCIHAGGMSFDHGAIVENEPLFAGAEFAAVISAIETERKHAIAV